MAECALATSTLQKPAAGNASWPATISDIYTTWVNGMDVDECEMVSLLVIAGCHLPAFFFLKPFNVVDTCLNSVVNERQCKYKKVKVADTRLPSVGFRS